MKAMVLSPQVILKSEPVHPFGLAVYGEHIFWTDWVRRAVQRANKYVGSDIKLLRVDIPQQPMGIIAVANDTNSCEWGRRHQPCCPASAHTHTHTPPHSVLICIFEYPSAGFCCPSHPEPHLLPQPDYTHTAPVLPAPPSVCACSDTLPRWAWWTEGPPHRPGAFLGLSRRPWGPHLHTHDLNSP